jgi:hypothetical protein
VHGSQIFLGPAEKMGRGREDDEKRKHCQQGQIGEVSGMDESVIVHTNNRPAQEFKDPRTRPDMAEQTLAVGMGVWMNPPRFGRFGRYVTH